MSDDESFSSLGEDCRDTSISGVWGESDFSVDGEGLNVSFVSGISIGQSSTPKRKKDQVTFKTPAIPPKEFVQCTRDGCRRNIKTQDGFNKHTLNHRLKDIATKVGGKNNIMQHLREDMTDVITKLCSQTKNKHLQEVCAVLENQGASQDWSNFVCYVLKIIDDVLGKNEDCVIMPSALRFGLQKTMNSSLCNKNVTDEPFIKLNLVTPCDKVSFSLFLFDLLWELMNRCVLYVCKSMMNNMPAPNVLIARNDTDLMHIQLLHHVAGFSLYHHVSHANKYPKNEKLQRVKDCILSKFTETTASPVMDRHDKAYWTHLLNRKSLMFVHERAFPFYMELGDVVLTSTEKDGSILLEKVLEKVVQNSYMLALWDSVVDNVLNENESFDLLNKTVKIVARTCGRGSMFKKMNLIAKNTKMNKQTLGVSHRARLL